MASSRAWRVLRYFLIVAVAAAPLLQSAMAFTEGLRLTGTAPVVISANDASDADDCDCPCCGMGAVAHALICMGDGAVIAAADEAVDRGLPPCDRLERSAPSGIRSPPDHPPPRLSRL